MATNSCINSNQLLSTNNNPTFASLTLNNNPAFINSVDNSATSGIIYEENYNGVDASSFTIEYAQLRAEIISNTHGATKGKIVFAVDQSDTLTDYMEINGSTQAINLFKTLNISTLTASQVLLSDSSKNLISVAQLGLSNGGSNANLTASNGGIVYSTASAMAILSGTATAGKMLQSGATAAPTWSTPTYPSASGTAGKILRADGTNNVYSTSTFSDTYTASNLLYSNGANTVTGLATANNGMLVTSATGVPSILAGPGTTGNILQSNSAAAPSFSTATYPSVATSSGTMMRANGTNWVASTSTFSDTYTASNLLYSNGANTVTGLATGNNGVLITSGAGVPSISSTLPSAVQSNITALGALSALTATSIVTTDGSSNLVTVTSPTSYTPTIGDGTNNFTTSTAQGEYFKIGHMYFVEIWLVWTGKGSAVAGNNLKISLPATVGANAPRVTASIGYCTNIAWTGAFLTANANTTFNALQLQGIANGGAASIVSVSQAGTTGEFQCNVFYWDN